MLRNRAFTLTLIAATLASGIALARGEGGNGGGGGGGAGGGGGGGEPADLRSLLTVARTVPGGPNRPTRPPRGRGAGVDRSPDCTPKIEYGTAGDGDATLPQCLLN